MATELARCLPSCNAPMVMIVAERFVIVRCGHCGRIESFRPVLKPTVTWYGTPKEDA